MFRRLLELVFAVDSSPAKRGLDKLQGDVSKFKTNVVKDLKGSFAPITKFVSGAGAVTAFVAIGRKALDMAEGIKNATQEIGLSSDFLQRWIGVSKKYNIEQDQSIDLLKEFTQRVGEAREGEGELNEMLKRYGVSVRDSNGEMKTQKQLLFEVSELMKNAGDEAERLFIADQAFGGGGNGVARFLAEGKESLDATLDSMSVMDTEMIDRLAKAKQSWNELGNSITIATGNLIDFLAETANSTGRRGKMGKLAKSLLPRWVKADGSDAEPVGNTTGTVDGGESDADAAKAAQAKRLADFRAKEEAEKLAANLEKLEKSLASLKEQNRLKEMDTMERIVALEEKRMKLVQGNKGETVDELQKLIEAEKILGELGSLRERAKSEQEKIADPARGPSTSFAVSSLAAIGGGGLIGPSSSGEGAVLGENRKQTSLLREVREVLKEIERKESTDGIVLK